MGNSSSSDLTTVEAFALDDVGGYNDTDTEGLVHHSPPSSPLHTLSMQVAQAAVDRGVAPPDAPGGHAIHDDDDAVVLTPSSSYERGNCTHPAAAAAAAAFSWPYCRVWSTVLCQITFATPQTPPKLV